MKLERRQKRTGVKRSPSMRREWIEIQFSFFVSSNSMSPSMRREWIEMSSRLYTALSYLVSLHAEGVD